MGTVADASKQDLSELSSEAIRSLNRAADDLVAWADLVRDQQIP